MTAFDLDALAEKADELETCIDTADPTAGPADAQAATGGLVGKVTALIAALRAKDIGSIIATARDLFTYLLGGDEQSIQFQRQAAIGGRINWLKLISILKDLLPLILAA